VLAGKGDQVAMVFEGDEPTDIRKITYLELQRKVSQIANALKMSGVRKGDGTYTIILCSASVSSR
jgi:acetyl-CoA synthetase